MSRELRGEISQKIALLGAFCLFLSAVEYMIPKPLPFLRIGLANLPLMMALDILPFPAFLVLICIKITGQALITGTLFSYIFLFSLTGTFLSALVMYLLRKIFGRKRISMIGIGTAGAFISNISQLALAHVFIFQENTRYIAPPFLAAGILTGIVLGVFCEVFKKRSAWFKEQLSENKEQRTVNCDQLTENSEYRIINKEQMVNKRLFIYNNIFSSSALFVAGLLILPALLFNPSTEYRGLQFLFFWALALLCGKKTAPVFTILIIAFIVVFNLIIPYGRVIFSIGAFKITSGALTAGIHRAVTLSALVMLSKLTIRHDLKLPGAFGELLGESLRIFSLIMSRKYRVTAKNFITDIDEMMTELSREQGSGSREQGSGSRTRTIGYVVLIIVIALSWLPWIL